MNHTESRSLDRLAHFHGIQTSYLDVNGQTQTASTDTLSAILEVLGIDIRRGVREALRDSEEARAAELLEPVSVVQGRARTILLRIPSNWMDKPIQFRIRTENGDALEWSTRASKLKTRAKFGVGRSSGLIKQFSFPNLPHGYHDLTVQCVGKTFNSLLICAPTQSYSDPELSRAWGAFLPMYAVRSDQGWGAGGYREWGQLGQWVGAQGGKILGSLPILAAFLDKQSCEPSPYSPVSRHFWNEFYLDVPSLPGFADCPEARRLVDSAKFQKRLARFRSSDAVEYCDEMFEKRKVLEILAKKFFSQRSGREEFARFVQHHPHLEKYAAFRATMERMKTPWQQWPQRLREGVLKKGDYDAAARQYHLYVQWQAQRQMEGLLGILAGSGVKFYLDLPLGVHPNGYDVWAEQNLFALRAHVGAPPDGFFTKGQDWGFAPLHPQRLRAQRYRHLLELMRFQMRHTGLLRLDHVMALRRLYWIPEGNSAKDGAYVTYPEKELFALLTLESHRNKTVIVGENLGTVPPEVNARMVRHHIRQMFVVQFEVRPQEKKKLAPPVRRCVASLNTHDMPPFAAFLKGADLIEQLKLGLIAKADLAREKKNRRVLVSALIDALRKEGSLKTSKPTPTQIMEASLRFLAASDAEIVLLNLEDLWMEKNPQNTPGTSFERPNWVRKTKFSVEQMQSLRSVRAVLKMVNETRRSSH